MKLKGFTIGLLVGAGLTVASAAVASSAIRATLAPSVLKFHMNGKVATVDGAKGSSVIGYNGQTYVSVGALAQAVGATADDQAIGTASSGKRQIDLYYGDDASFGVKDSDGIASLSAANASLLPVFSPYGDVQYSTVTGLIKFNKDFSVSAKKLRLAIRTDGFAAESKEVVIDNPLGKPLKKGDVRAFTAYFYGVAVLPKTKLSLARAELSVATENIGVWTESQDGIEPGSGLGISVPIDIEAGPDIPWPILSRKKSGETAVYKAGEPIAMSVNVQAKLAGKKPVVLRTPLAITVEITNKATRKVVRRVSLPTLEAGEAFDTFSKVQSLAYAWDQKDSNGKPVPPGSYYLEFKGPAKIEYSDTPSSELMQNESMKLIPFDVTIQK